MRYGSHSIFTCGNLRFVYVTRSALHFQMNARDVFDQSIPPGECLVAMIAFERSYPRVHSHVTNDEILRLKYNK
jgi:hypothetical protein